MNKRLLSFFFVSVIVFIVFMSVSYSNKNSAPVGNTNAPNESSCASGSCHSSFALQQNLMDRISITANGIEVDANFTYSPNTSYAMVFSILQPRSRNGFSLTVLNENNQYTGTLAATGAPNAELKNGSGANSTRKYVGHTNSSGVSTWNFTWTAPSDSQQISFYGIANLSNNNNNTNGDSILTVVRTFTMEDTGDTSTSISNRELQDELRIVNNPLSKQHIQFSVDVLSPKLFQFEVFNLNGQLIYSEEKFLHSGIQNINLPISSTTGIHIFKVSSENKFASYKLIL
ncbi:MAG: choice-of-anchor V domain-containing protein [Chitinophagales bacterium]